MSILGPVAGGGGTLPIDGRQSEEEEEAAASIVFPVPKHHVGFQLFGARQRPET